MHLIEGEILQQKKNVHKFLQLSIYTETVILR